MTEDPTADDDELGEVPELVPARMVNEFAYCKRLFFLEWVERRFRDNRDTVDGRYQHRRVDQAGGTASSPDEESGLVDGLQAARQVQLSSVELGLVGRVDLLESEDGVAVPVDYKRGTVPATSDRSWEPERVQLCVTALLLRANGYRCDRGVIYFVESRQRVKVLFDDALVTRTLALLSELRTVAEADQAPPPLVDSPKCPRCSLVSICLPDETNTLLERSARPPRRLIPSNDEGRPLYVRRAGSQVTLDGGRLKVVAPSTESSPSSRRPFEVAASIRLIDVSQVCLFGNVQVTTQALRALFDQEVPTLFLSFGGWLQGVASPPMSKHVELRRRQVIALAQRGLVPARSMVAGKIRNARTLLRRNGRPAPERTVASLAELARSAAEAPSIPSLLGIEGAAARLYFQGFTSMLRPELRLPGAPFSFDGRNRRPPTDAVNCLLSYLYALVVKDLVATCIGVGLDPYIGVYHRIRFGRPALALDLAEEFRPLIGDSVVLNLINNGEVRPSDFVVRAGGVGLTDEGRKAALQAYERRLDIEVTHPVFGYTIAYRRVLEVQARLLAAHLLGELPGYTPMVTR